MFNTTSQCIHKDASNLQSYAHMIERYRKDSIVRNAVLATLHPHLFERIRASLSLVELRRHSVIHDADKVVDWVYFIETGGVSRVVSTRADSPIEVAMVGSFGFVGLSVVLGTTAASHRAIVHFPGSALRISADELRAAMKEEPALREHLLRYVYLLVSQQAQTVLCSAKHGLDQRLARWLLLAHDWVSGNPVPVTHDLLATMLGSWRPNVTEALAILEREGVISRARGAIRILDSSALRAHACECHRLIEEKFKSTWHGTVQRYEHRLN